MNRQLIEDEGSRNPMSLRQLEARMMGWLTEGWVVAVILRDGQSVGYCLYCEMPDEYLPDRTIVYLRQFFIDRSAREQGIGQAAFQKLMREWFPQGATVTVDVLEINPRGRRFWEKLGFGARYTNLEREVDGQDLLL